MSIKTFVDVGELYRNAQRPAILSSVKAVLDFYGASNRFDEVYFNGEAEVSRTVLSSNTDKLRDDRATDTINRRKLFVVAEINPSLFNTGYGNSSVSPNNTPVWYSEETKTFIFPGYEGREVSVECNCFFRTRTDAMQFVNRINRASSRQLAEFTFNAKVHYPINMSIINFLKDTYDLGVKAGVITDDFPTWYFKKAISPMNVITNEGNNNPLVVLERRSDDMNIIFEEPSISKSTKGNHTGQHLVNFRYKFYWQDLVEWQLHYPMMIYQQPIPDKWIPTPQEEFFNGFIKNAFLEYQDTNLVYQNRIHNAPFYYRYPTTDTWYPSDTEWLDPQACIALTLSNDANQLMMNINEIPNWKWKDSVLAHMLKYRQYIFDRHEDIIHIKVYSDDLQVKYDQITMDEEGNLLFDRPPTMGNIYRVVIYVDKDLKGLSTDAIGRIINDPDYQNKFIPDVFYWHDWTHVPNHGEITDKRGDGFWPDKPYKNKDQNISNQDDWYAHADAQDMGPGTVRFSPVFYQLDHDLIAKNKG